MEEIKRDCSDNNLWCKVYADDLVLITAAQRLDNVLETLFNVSQCYNLQVNPKKSAILSPKGHSKLMKINLRSIPIVLEYCYLEVTVDDHGSINSHLERVVQLSSYLRAKMRFHRRFLNF